MYRTGNVAEGCLSMLSELPIVRVKVEDLQRLVTDPSTSFIELLASSNHPFSNGFAKGRYYTFFTFSTNLAELLSFTSFMHFQRTISSERTIPKSHIRASTIMPTQTYMNPDFVHWSVFCTIMVLVSTPFR